MRVRRGMRARHPGAAAHAVVLMLAACALLVAGFMVVGPVSATGVIGAVAWPAVAIAVLGAVVFAVVPPERLDAIGAFVLVALAGIAALAAMVLAIGNASVGSQAFLALAVLYAGFQLRAGAAWVVTVAAVLAAAVMLFSLQAADVAVTDLVFSGAVLLVMTALLVRTQDAQDRLVAELEKQAGIDPLTGLVTRRVLDDAVARALTAATFPDGAALVLVDVDEFKSINDSHGHPAGDAALVHLAAVITREVRAEDAVVSRLGGDELAILLPGCPPDVAARRAQDLLEAVRSAPLALDGNVLMVLSVSIGVAHAPRHAADLRTLYAAADRALYEAKRAGRGRVAVAA